MLIPYGTDAPIYYLPFATVGMILLNAAVSIGAWWATGGIFYIEVDASGQTHWIVEEMILHYGNGLRPWQWITSNFMHADFMHLLGNMFCLWGFGLVVEGKIGWQRFLAVYFGIGIIQCAVEQTFLLFASDGGSLGASSIIFGLLAICMIWAPQNDMNCIFMFFLRPIVFDASLYIIATVALLIQIGTGMLAGLSMTSQVLHLMGAGVGFAVGILMLKKGLVDCEGWDLFSVWSGKTSTVQFEDNDAAAALLQEAHDKRMAAAAGEFSSRSATAGRPVVDPDMLTPPPLPMTVQQDSTELAAMRSAIAVANPARAMALFEQLADDPLNWPLPEKELIQTIALFHKQSLWNESIPAMVAYLANFTTQDDRVRLKLAHVLIDAAHRPRQALHVLEKMNAALLPEKEATTLAKLTQRAEAKLGTVNEPPVEDW